MLGLDASGLYREFATCTLSYVAWHNLYILQMPDIGGQATGDVEATEMNPCILGTPQHSPPMSSMTYIQTEVTL